MKLGRHDIPLPIYLAPMAGITDSSFRLLMREMGCPVVVSELISSEAAVRSSQRTMRMIRIRPGETPCGIQIFGHDPVAMAETAAMVVEAGADFVDINLGCPVRKIICQGAGAALLIDHPQLQKILLTVKAAISVPLTIKIRTGFNDDQITVHDTVKLAADCGVAVVAIHGRTRAQGYEGSADWQLLAEVKRRAPLPIIGNGDLVDAVGAVSRWRESGCDGIMIGRAALRNPWIFQEIAAVLTGSDTAAIARRPELLLARHAQLLSEVEEPHVALLKIKKFVAWYTAGLQNGAKFRDALFKMRLYDEVLSCGMEFFGKRNDWRVDLPTGDRFLMGGHG